MLHNSKHGPIPTFLKLFIDAFKFKISYFFMKLKTMCLFYWENNNGLTYFQIAFCFSLRFTVPHLLCGLGLYKQKM